MKTNTTLVIGAVAAMLAAAGCSASKGGACNSPSLNHQTVRYDPTNNVTIIENEGFTWRLRGNVTYIVIYPKDSQHSAPTGN